MYLLSLRTHGIYGLFFILAALMVALYYMGVLGNVNVFSLIVAGLMLPVIATSIVHFDFGGVFFPLAVICILYDDFLGIQSLTPWLVLLIALLLTVGFSFLFPKYKISKHKGGEKFETIGECGEDGMNIETKFSSKIQYISTEDLKSLNINSCFGGVKVYMDNAKIAGDSAVVNIYLDFSGLEIYVPKSWKVADNVHYAFSDSEEKNSADEVAEKTLVLRGKASFSGISIIYV